MRSTLLRPTPRIRSSYSALGHKGAAPPVALLQDPCQRLGRLPPTHREACLVPSSGRARGLSFGGPRTWPTSRGRRSGTTWRRASRHVSLRRTLGEERPTLRSSSPRHLSSVRKQEQYAATVAHLVLLPTQARVASYTSASTSQGSTVPHLRSASGLCVLADVRARLTATFACRSACRAWQPPSSTICGASWQVRRPGTMQSWRRWRRSSGGHLSLQSLPRLRVSAAREKRLLCYVSSATPTPLLQPNQVTFFQVHSAGSAPGLHHP